MVDITLMKGDKHPAVGWARNLRRLRPRGAARLPACQDKVKLTEEDDPPPLIGSRLDAVAPVLEGVLIPIGVPGAPPPCIRQV
jgi:hypothetical protein